MFHTTLSSLLTLSLIPRVLAQASLQVHLTKVQIEPLLVQFEAEGAKVTILIAYK
jgi:hypothetical protein